MCRVLPRIAATSSMDAPASSNSTAHVSRRRFIVLHRMQSNRRYHVMFVPFDPNRKPVNASHLADLRSMRRNRGIGSR
jgi:hypothetical protein